MVWKRRKGKEEAHNLHLSQQEEDNIHPQEEARRLHLPLQEEEHHLHLPLQEEDNHLRQTTREDSQAALQEDSSEEHRPWDMSTNNIP